MVLVAVAILILVLVGPIFVAKHGPEPSGQDETSHGDQDMAEFSLHLSPLPSYRG